MGGRGLGGTSSQCPLTSPPLKIARLVTCNYTGPEGPAAGTVRPRAVALKTGCTSAQHGRWRAPVGGWEPALALDPLACCATALTTV